MTLEEKAFVIKVLAQANGQLTGDPVLLQAGVMQWDAAHADKFLLRQAHLLDAQHHDRPLCPGCPTEPLCRQTGAARAALDQLEKAACAAGCAAGAEARAAAARQAKKRLDMDCP